MEDDYGPYRKWKLHACFLDKEDIKITGERMWRVHLNTPWFHFAVGLTPNWRFSRYHKVWIDENGKRQFDDLRIHWAMFSRHKKESQ